MFHHPKELLGSQQQPEAGAVSGLHVELDVPHHQGVWIMSKGREVQAPRSNLHWLGTLGCLCASLSEDLD